MRAAAPRTPATWFSSADPTSDLEGVILRDSSTWTIPIRQSDRVSVKNVKLLGYRANSDGIDICNSRDVTVEGCFIRTLDDLIVVKSDKGQGEVKRIVARDCVLWNEVAHALSVGAELRENVDDVLFTDCDVIHDKGREWTLRVFHCDSARISNIRFENIRIEEARNDLAMDRQSRVDPGRGARADSGRHLQGHPGFRGFTRGRTDRHGREPWHRGCGLRECRLQWQAADPGRAQGERLCEKPGHQAVKSSG